MVIRKLILMPIFAALLVGCGEPEKNSEEAKPQEPEEKTGKIASECPHCGLKIPNEQFEFHKTTCTKKP